MHCVIRFWIYVYTRITSIYTHVHTSLEERSNSIDVILQTSMYIAAYYKYINFKRHLMWFLHKLYYYCPFAFTLPSEVSACLCLWYIQLSFDWYGTEP